MNSPLIVKMRFKTPTTSNQKLNRNYATYIATRPGTVMNNSKSVLDEFSPDTAAGHAKYASERPGSHGLFGKNQDKLISLTSIQSELSNHKGIVWQYIVSLRSDDAENLGFEKKGDWERFMRATTDQVFKEMGINSSNGKWVAAFHEEAGHPHVHLMMWEKDPKKEEGKLDRKEMRNVRNIFLKHIAKEERQQLNLLKTLSRDNIGETTKILLDKSILSLVGKDEKLPNEVKLDTKQLKYVYKEFKQLAEIIPTKGRLAYGYMPEEVKEELNNFSKWMLQQPQFKTELTHYIESVQKLASYHLKDPQKIEDSTNNALKDLEKRLSNQVLKSVDLYRKSERVEVKQRNVLEFEKALLGSNVPIKSLEKQISEITKSILLDKGLSKDEMIKVFAELKDAGGIEVSIKDFLNANKVDVNSVESKLNDLAALSPYLKNKFNLETPTVSDKNFSLSKMEWEILKRSLDLKSDPPYEVSKKSELLVDKKELTSALSNMILVEKNMRNIVFKQLIIMKEANIDPVEQASVIKKCLGKNKIHYDESHTNWINQQINKIASQQFLAGQNVWSKLENENNLNMKYPFSSTYQFIPNRESAIKVLQEVEMKIDGKIIDSISSSQVHSLSKLNSLAKNVIEHPELKQLLERKGQYDQTKTNLNALNAKWELKNKERVTLNRLTTVLISSGMKDEEVKATLNKWNMNSNSQIPEKNIEDVIKTVSNKNAELQRYGGNVSLTKQEYKYLLSELKMNGVKDVYNYPKESVQISVITDLWKGAFKSLQHEITQSEYEAQRRLRQRLMKEKNNERKNSRGR
ncbi:MobP3 family relaxase [Exiguobacterium antarcticum]|uniref:MobP3 family relaxase n=1 Tax=Exiguobacterium antarcticum TaxID=132920 RepID=A0ABT6R4W8_9BACL|nr:MobP3 family relaxase [Exiguobacterium antarcticum]MDI3235982.1 MobP3 family relaxase [Exiguobacterium antarcticum]